MFIQCFRSTPSLLAARKRTTASIRNHALMEIDTIIATVVIGYNGLFQVI